MTQFAAKAEDSFPNLERLLSVERVAQAWSMKPHTVRLWARTGKLPGFQIGRLWFFEETALRDFLARKRA
jgi:hypothetical protein